ncbi:hypothetical protein N7449_006490 [Penicillium cf. viridicatum]|uniref:Uncharacterized protein n=1 Tax=Penicillium cf. viridicatum TaxID=2972119 RepID=A0A9W9JH98_9EURO|nr:hypothetical protein N7449_006490 [Penicillium cf. viridicatum]
MSAPSPHHVENLVGDLWRKWKPGAEGLKRRFSGNTSTCRSNRVTGTRAHGPLFPHGGRGGGRVGHRDRDGARGAFHGAARDERGPEPPVADDDDDNFEIDLE